MWKDILYLTIQNLIINNIPKKEEYFCIELAKLENNKECSFYQLSINSDETHACIPDEINEKCKEEYKWNKVPKILEVRLELNSCSYYSVSNNSLFVCINDTSINSNYSCKEKCLFNQVLKGENINCLNYPVINEDNIYINNYNNVNEYACKE